MKGETVMKRIFALMVMLVMMLAYSSADVWAVNETGTCGHENIVPVKAIAATCQAAGMKAHYKCEACGKLFKDAKGRKAVAEKKLIIKRKKHIFKRKVLSGEYLKSDATCTKPAIYYYACKTCDQKGKKTFKSGKALGHKYEQAVTKATTTKDGSVGQKCTVCGKKGKGKKIYKASKITLPKKYKNGVAYVGGNKEAPAIEVKNSKGKKISAAEYEITYENTYDPVKGVGTGKAIVSFNGSNYSGTKSLNYKITGVRAEEKKIESVDDLPYSGDVIYGKPFALINENQAFLSAENDTLILSDTPYLWKLEKGKNGSHIVSAQKADLIFDLDNADYSNGNSVHLYGDTGYECQYWNLNKSGSGFVITSAEKPEWCVRSREKGFVLGSTASAGSNDTWKIVNSGSWTEYFKSPAKAPFYKYEDKKNAVTPDPEFWGRFDAEGITSDMKAAAPRKGESGAPYLSVYPDRSGMEDAYDFFSVEFCTDSQPDYTYWCLAQWEMDVADYMKQKAYTKISDDAGGYGGLQDTGSSGNEKAGITSMWDMKFYKDSENVETIHPACLYPEGAYTDFSHEGEGTGMVRSFDWKAKTWYRFVLRSWEHDDTTYVGTWVEDLSAGEVRQLAVYDTFLPHSSMAGGLTLFLENFSGEAYDQYRQMQLRNICIRGAGSGKWYYPDKLEMSIWTSLGSQGTYRYSVSGDTYTGETCGLGQDLCSKMSEKETWCTMEIKPAAKAPDTGRYPIPEL